MTAKEAIEEIIQRAPRSPLAKWMAFREMEPSADEMKDMLRYFLVSHPEAFDQGFQILILNRESKGE